MYIWNKKIVRKFINYPEKYFSLVISLSFFLIFNKNTVVQYNKVVLLLQFILKMINIDF